MAGAQSYDITINVLHYADWYTLRKKDEGKHHWFSFPNDLLTHPDFYGITGDEFKAFVFCVSICSKVRNSQIRVNVPHSSAILFIEQNNFLSMFTKLQGKQIDIIGGFDTTAARPYKASTEEKKREEERTEEKKTGEPDEVALVFDFWNSQEKLPKAMRLTSARRVKIKMRLKESGLENLKSVILTITETPFLLGQNDRNWKADLDWLIANELNGIKVSEGKYKSAKPLAVQGTLPDPLAHHKAQIERFRNKEQSND